MIAKNQYDYACQDVGFDEKALVLSRVFHVLAVGMMAGAFRRAEGLGMVSLIGVAIMAGLLAWEQSIVRAGDLRHINRAFFEINSWIGVVLLGVVLGDMYLL